MQTSCNKSLRNRVRALGLAVAVLFAAAAPSPSAAAGNADEPVSSLASLVAFSPWVRAGELRYGRHPQRSLHLETAVAADAGGRTRLLLGYRQQLSKRWALNLAAGTGIVDDGDFVVGQQFAWRFR